MAEVFISYSQKDPALVTPIAERLTELGVDAWYDRRILAGQAFDEVIYARLNEAKAVLACWSPTAIGSQWVRGEAEYARGKLGTYLPIFIAPCALPPPFNLIQTEDLSNWTGEAKDTTWIELVDRIAALIGRERVAAAVRALASGDDQVRYDFARRYPDEPAARKIWVGADARHREYFARNMAEAKAAVDRRIDAERGSLEAHLKAAAPAFEVWLAEERRAAAKGPMPSPLDLIEQAQPGKDASLREEIATLRTALAEANTKEKDLVAAKAEMARLSGDLAALKAREAQDLPEHIQKEQRLRDEIAALSGTLSDAKAKEKELETAKAEIVRISQELAASLERTPLGYSKARKRLEEAAGKGDAKAMIDLALLYEDGLGVTRDYGKAAEWFEKAANKGEASAMIKLGYLYENGLGPARDYAKGHEWYEKAADKGDAVAMYRLGMLYGYGHGLARDDAQAREWYEKAAHKGDLKAMYNLGVFYQYGRGVTRDYVKAHEWYQKAGDEGDATADAELAQTLTVTDETLLSR
jgi:hypothetical protein